MNTKLIAGIAGVVILGGGYVAADTVYHDIAVEIVEQSAKRTFGPGGYSYDSISTSLISNNVTLNGVTISDAIVAKQVSADALSFNLSGYFGNIAVVGYSGNGVSFDVLDDTGSEKARITADAVTLDVPGGTPAYVASLDDLPRMKIAIKGASVKNLENEEVEITGRDLVVGYDDKTGDLVDGVFSDIALVQEGGDGTANVGFKRFEIDGFPLVDFLETLQQVTAADADALTEQEQADLGFKLGTLISTTNTLKLEEFVVDADIPSDDLKLRVTLDKLGQVIDKQTGNLDTSYLKNFVLAVDAAGEATVNFTLESFDSKGFDTVVYNRYFEALTKSLETGEPIPADISDAFMASAENLLGIDELSIEKMALTYTNPAQAVDFGMSMDRMGIDYIKREGGVAVEYGVSLENLIVPDMQDISPQAGPVLQAFDINELVLNIKSVSTYEKETASSTAKMRIDFRDLLELDLDGTMDATSLGALNTAIIQLLPPPGMDPQSPEAQQRVAQAIPQILGTIEGFTQIVSIHDDGGVDKILNGYAVLAGPNVTADQLKAALPLQLAGGLVQAFPVLNMQGVIPVTTEFLANPGGNLTVDVALKDGKTGTDLMTITPATMGDILDVAVTGERPEGMPEADSGAQ